MEGISSKSHGDFYCYGCLHSFRTEIALKNHVDLCQNNKSGEIELPKNKNNLKKYKPGVKSLKMNTVIYAGFESILVPYNTCKNETNKSINKHIACGYSINVLDNHSNRCKQTYYRGDNVASVFCKEIRAIAYKKINFVKSEMIELTLDEQKEYENAKYCHICKKVFGDKKNDKKVRDHDHCKGKYHGSSHSICNLRYSTQKDIPVLFHNGINYDFNLIITELAKEFRGEFQYIPVITNKYISFPISIRKKVYANAKNTQKKYVTYNLNFIDSARHMNASLSNLVDNLSEINKCNCDSESLKNIKVTYRLINNKKIVHTTCKTCKSRKDQLFSGLINKFPCTFKLCRNVRKFMLLLRKGVYAYEYMDS